MSSRLSVFDLPLFFEERHESLGERLEAFELGDGDDRDLVTALAAADLLTALVPADGETIDVRALCLIRERLAAISPAADSIFAVQGLGTTPLRLAGHADAALLARARAGDAVFGFALTEPEAGSDVASISTVAEKTASGFRLTGGKTLISNVGIATHYTVFATADPAAGRDGISAFLVPADATGLREEPMSVICEHPIGALHFDGVELDASALVGELGGGFRLAMRTLDTFRVTVGAAAIGMARRAFDLAFAHTRTRRQFGAPLADNQMVMAQIADMATELDAARLLVYRAAGAIDSGERATREVAQAKLFATEAAQRIIDRAVQLHGGRGVVTGEPAEMLYRAIRPLRIYEGASEIQKLIIYRQLARELQTGDPS